MKKQFKNFKKYYYMYIIWLVVCVYAFIHLFIVFNALQNILGLNYTSYPWFALTFDSSLFFIVIISSIAFYVFNSIALYIYSYYIYTGNKNWYKFFRDRVKKQKKENRIAYKEYLKNIKEKKSEKNYN